MWEFYFTVYVAAGFIYLLASFDFEGLLEEMCLDSYYEPLPLFAIFACYLATVLLFLLFWPWLYFDDYRRWYTGVVIPVNLIMSYQPLVKLFCSMQVYSQKSLNYHWNVTGPDFYQAHLLLGRVYESVDAFKDRLAEHIRGYGRAPGSYAVFLQLSSVKENLALPGVAQMLVELLSDLQLLRSDLKLAADAATESNRQGTLNLLGDIDECFDTLYYLLSSSQLNFNVWI